MEKKKLLGRKLLSAALSLGVLLSISGISALKLSAAETYGPVSYDFTSGAVKQTGVTGTNTFGAQVSGEKWKTIFAAKGSQAASFSSLAQENFVYPLSSSTYKNEYNTFIRTAAANVESSASNCYMVPETVGTAWTIDLKADEGNDISGFELLLHLHNEVAVNLVQMQIQIFGEDGDSSPALYNKTVSGKEKMQTLGYFSDTRPNKRQPINCNGLIFTMPFEDEAPAGGKYIRLTFSRTDNKTLVTSANWGMSVSGIKLSHTSAATAAVTSPYPQAVNGTVVSDGGNTLVEGMHNLETKNADNGEFVAFYAGRDGDDSFYGVFKVPENCSGKSFAARFLVGFANVNPGVIIKYTSSTEINNIDETANWTAAEVSGNTAMNRNAYYASYSAEIPSGAAYIYFEHPQSTSSSDLWRSSVRGGIRAVQFMPEDSNTEKTATVIMDAQGMRNFSAAVKLAGITPEQAQERIKFEVSANGTSYDTVTPRFTPADSHGLYTVSAAEAPLDEGIVKIRVSITGSSENYGQIQLRKISFSYPNQSFSVNGRDGDFANGTWTYPTAANYLSSVTVTAVPGAGYRLASVAALTDSGESIPVELDHLTGTASFNMPDGNVWLTVRFEEKRANELILEDIIKILRKQWPAGADYPSDCMVNDGNTLSVIDLLMIQSEIA